MSNLDEDLLTILIKEDRNGWKWEFTHPHNSSIHYSYSTFTRRELKSETECRIDVKDFLAEYYPELNNFRIEFKNQDNLDDAAENQQDILRKVCAPDFSGIKPRTDFVYSLAKCRESDLEKIRIPKKPKEDPRKPKRYISATKAIIRLRKIEGEGYSDEIVQRQGVIYKLDDKDPSALALYGGHQVIVLDDDSFDMGEWMIVSVTELW